MNNELLFHASEMLVISHEISIFGYEEITRLRVLGGRNGALGDCTRYVHLRGAKHQLSSINYMPCK